MPRKVTIAKTTEIAPGERIVLEVERTGLWLAVFNVEGQFFAIEDRCTHDDGPLGDGEIDGFEVECPRHGARFDVRTGDALTMPAVKPVPSFPLEVVGEDILIEIE